MKARASKRRTEEEAAPPATSCNLLNSEIWRDRESQAPSIRQLWITMKLFYYSARVSAVSVRRLLAGDIRISSPRSNYQRSVSSRKILLINCVKIAGELALRYIVYNNRFQNTRVTRRRDKNIINV